MPFIVGHEFYLKITAGNDPFSIPAFCDAPFCRIKKNIILSLKKFRQ